MTTKETTHNANRTEHTENCKSCHKGKCVLSCFACVFALLASIFSILAFVNIKNIGGNGGGDSYAQKNYEWEVAQVGGQANFDKLKAYYSSNDFVQNVTPQIDAMVGQASAGTDNTPSAPTASKTLDQSTISDLLSNAHYYGNADAKILILEYSDFLCSYCYRQYSEQTIEGVVANHPNDVALVFQNFPLSMHPWAELAAKGLYCVGEVAGSEAFYTYIHNTFWTSQFTDASVLELAKGVGVDEGAFTTCYASTEATNAVNQSISNGSNLFNINGTPGNIVLNRETGEYILIEGAYPASEFENAVNQLLS